MRRRELNDFLNSFIHEDGTLRLGVGYVRVPRMW